MSICSGENYSRYILTLQQQSFTIYTTLDGEWVSRFLDISPGTLEGEAEHTSRAHKQILEAIDFNKFTSVRVQSQGQSFGLPDLCSGDYRLYMTCITPQGLCSTSFSEEMFSYKWIISDAEQILSQSLSSSRFPGNTIAYWFYLSAQWVRDVAEEIQPAKLSVTLGFINPVNVRVSNLHFLIVDCFSKRIVKGKDRSLQASISSNNPYGFSTLQEAITIPENEPLKNFLHNGALTIQVTGTIMNTSPNQLIINSSVIPKHGFSELMNRMFQDGLFTDLTIVVGEKTFKVHKVVLGSQSDVFKRMLESDMKEKNEAVVEIADIAPAVMEDFLAYLYTGSPPNIKNFAKELLLVADKYDIMRLRLLCENELKMGLTVENVTSVLLLADKVQQESGSSLLEACIKFINQHSAAVQQSEEWAQNISDLSNDLVSKLSV